MKRLLLNSCLRVISLLSRRENIVQRFPKDIYEAGMDSNCLLDLSKEDLVKKIKCLEEECRILKKKSPVPTSKYQALVEKFEKNSGKKRKRQKNFDSALYPQRKVALRVIYFGWDYMGLQDNPGLDDTIEKIVWEALKRTKLLVGDVADWDYSKCGRTDKGVSAFSQVLCMNLRSRITAKEDCGTENKMEATDDKADEELDYCGILNRVLPEEIKVTAWAAVDEPFSARHHCVGRTYKYYFPRGSLNIKKMNEAAQLFTGTHDFRNFCKLNVEERVVYVRELRGFEITFDNFIESSTDIGSPYQMCAATIHGTGFLYHQVRYMMGVLFLIGMGFEEPDVITDLLDVEKTPRRPQYGLAEDFPLVLYDCRFEGLKWNVSKATSRRLESDLKRWWSSLAIKTALARSMMDKFLAENTHIAPKEINVETGTGEPLKTTQVEHYDINGYLLKEKFTSKQYKKVVKRVTGMSLEEKIENMENRKRRKLEADVALSK